MEDSRGYGRQTRTTVKDEKVAESNTGRVRSPGETRSRTGRLVVLTPIDNVSVPPLKGLCVWRLRFVAWTIG